MIECSPRPKTVILKEDDNTLFAEARKILVRNDKIFVLDPVDGRTAVSFTMEGEPYARYGRAGNGPGEYFRPWDIDVDSTGVYILDSNHKKVLKYSIEGDFIKDFDIPFFSYAFALLDNGHFLFNLPEDGTAAPQLCVADSTVTELKYHLSYKEGQVGGWSTDNAINKTRIKTFYKAPADTVYILDREGVPSKGIVLDFNGKGFSEEAKLDFGNYSERDLNNGAEMLLDNPFPLPNGLWVGAAEDKDNRYCIIFDPVKNLCGGKKTYSENPTRPNSVFDMFWLCGADEEGNPISLLEEYALELCNDIDSLDEKTVEALRDGNRVLVFYNLKHPGE